MVTLTKIELINSEYAVDVFSYIKHLQNLLVVLSRFHKMTPKINPDQLFISFIFQNSCWNKFNER